jgi:hypothetical protein
MKKLAVLAIVLIVGGVIVDSALRSYASNRVASEMRSALNLPKDPDVEIGGFPFVVEAIRGRIESVKISADGLEEAGVAVTEIELTMRDVRISLAKIISGKSKRIRIGSISGVGRLTADDLAAALGQTGLDVSVVDPGDVTVSGTTLSVGPATVELPEFVNGIDYTEARIEGDSIVLQFETERTTLEIS